jgi:ABC-type antimicrobial peptide transport system permease subunit
LILGGAFFVTSLARVLNEEPGFRTRDAAIVQVSVHHMRVPRDRGPELAEAVGRLPGVSNAALFTAPVLRRLFETSQFRLPGAERPPDYRPASFEIGAGFFEASGIRLVEGRLPSDAELDAQSPVLAVSETVAQTYWPDRSAVGQTLMSWRRVPFTVVGVVADVRWAAPDFEPDGAIYSTWAEGRTFILGFSLLVTLERDTTTSDLSAAVARMLEGSPDFWTMEVRSVEEALVETIRTRRLSALMASVFGGVALLIVAVGLLGLVGMTASRRTREVGIRMALGAPRSGVVRQLVGEQLGAVTAGILAGAVIAAWVVRLIQAQLYETSPADPLVWMTSVVVLLAVATIGALAPAVRASRVDPVQALRQD